MLRAKLATFASLTALGQLRGVSLFEARCARSLREAICYRPWGGWSTWLIDDDESSIASDQEHQ